MHKPQLKLIKSDTLADPSAQGPLNSPNGGDPANAIFHPTLTPNSRQSPPLFPTAPPKSASHQVRQTENQKRVLRYAIQNELGLLSTLEGALSKYQRLSPHHDGDKVRPAVTALLHTVTLAQRQYEAFDKQIQESPTDDRG